MRLSTLAAEFEIIGADREISAVTEDSRKAIPGSLFVAIDGTAQDGHAYIDDAVGRGAGAVAAGRLDGVPGTVARIRTPDPRGALATFAARFYGHPAGGLELIGFTGTFGKTSTSEVLRTLLEAAGSRPAVLGSLGAKYKSFQERSSGLTTPAPVELHRALRGLRDAGADRVITEVTSHALCMRRVDGLTFRSGLLAAIEHGEHTDFHRTHEEYVNAKRLFLDYLTPGAVLAYDADNDAARALATSRPDIRPIGFSLRGRSDVTFSDVTLDASGAHFRVDSRLSGAAGRCMHSALLGSGHLRNVALALTYAFATGMDPETAARVLPALEALPRRMERYAAGGRTVLDDTAAHPDSFRATFAVAVLLPHRRTVVVYAVRGNRGADINSRNADALAQLASQHHTDSLIVTAATDVAGAEDRVTDAELDATRQKLAKGRCPFSIHGTLQQAAAEALRCSGPGDLIVLIGAQGMNEGRRILQEALQ